MKLKISISAMSLAVALGGGHAMAQPVYAVQEMGYGVSFGSLQGEFDEGYWDQRFDPEDVRKARLSIALAMIIPNIRKYRVDAEPALLQREVNIRPATSRKTELERLAYSLGVVVSKNGQSIGIARPEPIRVSAAITPMAAAASQAVHITAAQPEALAIKDQEPAKLTVASVVDVPATSPVAAIEAESAPIQTYRATLADGNIRQVLVRWAAMSGWTFAPEHWSAAVDISLSAEADFGSDFRTSARELLAATEMSTTPLQPCFYSNHVLRVIPVVERCDRTRSN